MMSCTIARPESRAAFHALSVAAEEALEEIRLLVRRHARAVVLHDDFAEAPARSHRCHSVDRQRHARAFDAERRNVLERVVDQIRDALRAPARDCRARSADARSRDRRDAGSPDRPRRRARAAPIPRRFRTRARRDRNRRNARPVRPARRAQARATGSTAAPRDPPTRAIPSPLRWPSPDRANVIACSACSLTAVSGVRN